MSESVPPLAPRRRSVVGRLFSSLGHGLDLARSVLVNVLFFGFLIVVALAALNTCQTLTVPPNSALLINPQGIIVEQTNPQVALQDLVAPDQRTSEVAMTDLVDAISFATTDDDIQMLVMNLDHLAYASPAQASRLGQHLRTFAGSGKKIVAWGNYFAQHQYHLASFADAVYMHPLGQVLLPGYGGNSLYMKDLLDKLAINVHVFRAGEFKSAVEPMTRNNMSPEARLAAESLYQDLWQQFLAEVAANRKLTPLQVQAYADDFPELVAATQGDFARAGLENHLVDELLSADQARERIADEVGYDALGNDINAIDFMTYLQARAPAALVPDGAAQVAVLTVQGPIVMDGDRQMASSRQLVPLIRQARYNDDVHALVVRIDSPGGSQFASEVIRQELELLQLSGKPVVASFASTAASGGYWIGATADAIITERATITGSIGVFSLLTTFEQALAKVGVHTDGVGTSEQTLGLDALGGLSEDASSMLQSRVDHSYDQFLNLVARGRDKSLEAVRDLAGGRVWSGAAAAELGLVDGLGGLDEALSRAAELASLDNWEKLDLRQPVDARSLLLQQLVGPQTQAHAGPLERIVTQLREISALDDPLNLYTLCLACWAR